MREITPTKVGKILLLGLELGLLLAIVHLFDLEDEGFRKLSLLVLGGFLVHAFLPRRWRLGFFLLLSLASIPLVLGVVTGAWVIGLGLALIGICYLPVSFRARAGLILLAGGALAAARVGKLAAPWDSAVWPILSAMFMFRLMVYLYDVKHDKERPKLAVTLSYFFMLPNVCFPLFPIVDYKLFQRTWYKGEATEIYQRGVSWIFRGLVHLLLYRVAYQYLTIDPVTATGMAAALRYSLGAFSLYLQVSGSFHVIVGMLLLFGFNLPETHHLYFLASGFNDFWRRINIYWKDFMMKLFYYPVYFRVKKLGEARALVISTLIVFACTWLLHAYQWFWLRGTLLLEWHDGLFWAILAVLVVADSLYESRYGRERRLRARPRTVAEHVALGCRTLATFLSIGLLWGMWSSDSLAQWISIWRSTGAGWVVLLLLIPALFVASMLLRMTAKPPAEAAAGPASRLKPPPFRFWRQAAVSTSLMALICLAGLEAVYSRLPAPAATAADAFRLVQLNARDQARLERGYYENLIHVNRHGSELWQVLEEEPTDWGWNESNLVFTRPTDDLRHSHLLPEVEFALKGGTVRANRWGLRDGDYERAKPAATVRVAVLGASQTFGSGVDNDETFENVLERLLSAADGGVRYELLNFAFPGRDAVNQVAVLEMDVLDFAPDAILYVEHPRAARRLIRNLAQKIVDGVDLQYDDLRSVAERAGIDGDTRLEEARNRLAPFADEILEWSYRRMAEICRERGIRPLMAYLPLTHERYARRHAVVVRELGMARDAGFETISLVDVYDGHRPRDLAIARWDRHPNALAHRLIGERLYAALTDGNREPLAAAG